MDPEYPIYEWINKELCTKIVSSYMRKSCEITDLDIKYATRKGDNFTSALFRIKLSYSAAGGPQVHQLRFILKTPIQLDLMDAVSAEFNIFKRESVVYGTILEKCYNLLREKGDTVVFGPRPLYVEEKLLAMEDLTAMNYNLMGKGKKFNRHQCNLVLSKVARWHASTVVLFEKEPNLFENHHVPNFSEETEHMHVFFTNLLAAAMKHNRGAPELKNFTNKLAAFTADFLPKLFGVFKRDINGFSVLSHGDMWTNNILFRHNDEDNQSDDVLFVDFQEGFFGSPGIDLNYFLYTSVEVDLLLNHYDVLIAFYHGELEKTLKLLNYSGKLPTLQDIHNEIIKIGAHGLFTLLGLVPVMTTPHTQYAEASYFFEDTEETLKARDLIFSDQQHIKLVAKLLPRFVQNGTL
uniref:Putative ecdysteroid kinase n=1 Tax=Nyssomyia neivai TaxID=330878 RepID=A0A1L8DZT5_9DIPT